MTQTQPLKFQAGAAAAAGDECTGSATQQQVTAPVRPRGGVLRVDLSGCKYELCEHVKPLGVTSDSMINSSQRYGLWVTITVSSSPNARHAVLSSTSFAGPANTQQHIVCSAQQPAKHAHGMPASTQTHQYG